MSIWVASPPHLPPGPHLGPILEYEQASKRMIRAWASPVILLLACSVVAVILHSPEFLWATLPMMAPFVYQLIGARRYLFAVGEGWLYFRTEPLGGGWTTFEQLQSAVVKEPKRTYAFLQLQGPSFRARMILSHRALKSPSKLHRDIARQVLASDVNMDEGAREILELWAASTADTGRQT